MKPIPSTCGSRSLAEQVEQEWPTAAWNAVHVAVAVSGGPDSMALLATLVAIARRRPGGGEVFAAHVNHGLRPEADVEQRWLETECARLGVSFLSRRGNVAEVSQIDGDGLEAAARKVRYRLLSEMAESVGARFVAVGHTYDDQVETVVFRMLRGTGMRGLAGMPMTRPLTPSVTLVRPFRSLRRSAIRSFLAEAGQSAIVDESNDDLRFRRNRIRREMLPWLRENVNPDVDEAVWRLAEQAAELNELVESIAAASLADSSPDVRPDRGFSVNAEVLASLPHYALCEALRLAWRQCKLPEKAMTRTHWHRLAGFATGRGHDAPLNLPGNVTALRVGDRLRVEARRS